MSVWQVAKMVVAGVAVAANRLLMPVNRLGAFMASAPGFRAHTFKVSFLLLPAVIGLFAGSTLGFASCPTVSVRILLGGSSGTDITGMTESRYVGQQTVLYASYTPPSGVTVNSQSWSVPGTTVGGFNDATPCGTTPCGQTATNFNQQSTTFYWTVPANFQTVTFTLNLSDGESPYGETFFDVYGPTLGSPGVTTPPTSAPWGTWQVWRSAPPRPPA